MSDDIATSKLPRGAAGFKADYEARAAAARLVAKSNEASAEAYAIGSQVRDQFLSVARAKLMDAESWDRSAEKMQLALELEEAGFKPENLSDDAIDAAERKRAASLLDVPVEA